PSHCSLMRPAAERLAERLARLDVRRPVVPVIHNRFVAASDDPGRIRQALVEQLYNPVRWIDTIELFQRHGVKRVVECGPGKVIAEAGAKGAGRVLDVRDAAQCAAFVDKVQEEFGAVAILVNNAGVTRDNLLARMKDEEWDEIQATNLRSVFVLSRAVLRGMMKARTGRIINVTSVVGHTGNPGQANYAAAKAGVVGFSKSLAREVG